VDNLWITLSILGAPTFVDAPGYDVGHVVGEFVGRLVVFLFLGLGAATPDWEDVVVGSEVVGGASDGSSGCGEVAGDVFFGKADYAIPWV